MKALAITAALVAVLSLAGTPARAQQADLVFRNGVIWTVNAGNPIAQAIATRGDRIIFGGQIVFEK